MKYSVVLPTYNEALNVSAIVRSIRELYGNEPEILIVDDEPLALDLMERYVLRTPFLRLEAKCSGGAEALEALAGGGIDVAFLDIQMPGMNGLELSRLAGDRTRVIFTTAFQQYALEGFRADAIDYLLKPIDYNEFLRAAHKALKWFSLTREKTEPAPPAPTHTYLLVRSDYRQVRIDTSDILYIEALKDYVKIFLASSPQPSCRRRHPLASCRPAKASNCDCGLCFSSQKTTSILFFTNSHSNAAVMDTAVDSTINTPISAR